MPGVADKGAAQLIGDAKSFGAHGGEIFLSSLEDAAGFVKAEAWIAREKLAGIAVTQIAEKIGFPLAVRKELRIHLLLVEAGHGSAIEAQGARGHKQVGT